MVRAYAGSTAASHASAARVLLRPRFLTTEIIDSLNAGLDATFPLLYKEVLDTSLAGVDQTYEYTIPSTVAYLSQVDIKQSGDLSYRPERGWELRRGATPKIKFRRLPVPGATIRLHGYGPFPHFATTADSTDTQFPLNAESCLVYYAASDLLMSGEALRVRTDTGAIDNREQATRPGSSMAAALQMEQRFLRQLNRVSMSPLPVTIQAIA